MKKIIFTMFAMLNKKLILKAGLKDLNKTKLIEEVEAKTDAAILFPAIAPGLDPTPADVKLEITAHKTLETTIINKEAELAVLYKKAADNRARFIDIVTRLWMPAVETAIDGDEEKATKMHYDWIGKYPKVTPEVNVTNSHPVITEVLHSGNMQHTIHQVNNKTESWHLAFGATRVDLYIAYDEAHTHDLRKMHFLGSFTKDEFINKFSADDTHEWVWYVAVYVAKDANSTPELSGAIKKQVPKT